MTPISDMVSNNMASLPDSLQVIRKLVELQKKPVHKENAQNGKNVKYVLSDGGKVVFVHSATKKIRVKIRVKRKTNTRQWVKKTKTYKKKLFPKKKLKC